MPQNPTAALLPPSRKTVESPLIPVLVPSQDQRGLDAAGKNSCCNKKQQSTSADEFLPAAVNLAICDNVIMLMFKIKRQTRVFPQYYLR